MGRPYHHRHLRRALLDAALDSVRDSGPAALSLRDLARRAGVSHAAPAHHFGDKAGLLTALATEGWAHLAAALREAQGHGFLEVGVAYVRFAIQERAYFEVMFRPELYHPGNHALAAARAEAGNVLYELATAATTSSAGAPGQSPAQRAPAVSPSDQAQAAAAGGTEQVPPAGSKARVAAGGETTGGATVAGEEQAAAGSGAEQAAAGGETTRRAAVGGEEQAAGGGEARAAAVGDEARDVEPDQAVRAVPAGAGDSLADPLASREALSLAVAAWGLVHGVATLFLNGNLPPALGDDPLEITRRVAAQLFRN